MKKLLFICTAFLGLLACQDIQYPEKPDNLIPENKMVDIITDLYIFNASKSYNRNLLQESGLTMESFVFEKYQIDSLQFEKSNDYYAANIEKLEAIYKKAQARLELQQQEIDTLISKEAKLRDSISKPKDSIKSIIRNLPFEKRD